MSRFSQIRSTCAAVLSVLALTQMPGVCGAAVTVIGDVNPNPVVANQDVEIGANGYGEVTVDGGTQLETHRVTLGDFNSPQSLSVAIVRVHGAGSRWTMQDLEVRPSISSLLEVTAGGQMSVRHFSSIGNLPQIRVDGSNSVLALNASQHAFGNDSPVDLSLTNGGRLLAGDFYLYEGDVARLDGGILTTNGFENYGRISGGGAVQYSYMNNIGNHGVVEVGDQQLLSFQSYEEEPFLNNGQIDLAGGEFYAVDGLRNRGADSEPGVVPSITLDDAVLRVGYSERLQSGYLLNEGRIASVGGTSDVHGPVLSQFDSIIAATNNSVLLFHDPVTLEQSTLSVFAGSRAVFLDDLYLDNATLFAQLPGQPGNAAFGVAEVVGQLFIDGQLQVSLTGPYSPRAGDRFPLVTAGGGIVGQPSLAAAPPLPGGLAWSLVADANTLSLAVVEGLPGDFNADAQVDAADYTVWRDGLGAEYQQSDYHLWRDNYGAALEPASTTNAAPEPGAALLWVVAVGTLTARRTS